MFFHDMFFNQDVIQDEENGTEESILNVFGQAPDEDSGTVFGKLPHEDCPTAQAPAREGSLPTAHAPESVGSCLDIIFDEAYIHDEECDEEEDAFGYLRNPVFGQAPDEGSPPA